MNRKNNMIRRVFFLLLAAMLTITIVLPSAVWADDEFQPLEENNQKTGIITDDIDSKIDLKEDISLEERDEVVIKPVMQENKTNDAGIVTIAAGVYTDVVLPYSADETDAVLIRFDCNEDGIYSILANKDNQYIGVDWTTDNGIHLIVYGADGEGEVNYSDKKGDNRYRDKFPNPWYFEDSRPMVRMEAGKTYYFWLNNKYWDGSDQTRTFYICRMDVQLTVTNNSAATRNAVIELSGDNSTQNSILGYVVGDVKDLDDLEGYSQRNLGKTVLELPLASGESTTISILPYQDALNWKLNPKYDSDFDFTVDGDSAGKWTTTAKTYKYAMSFAYTPTQEADGETTTFHSIYDLTEINKGDHYILAAKYGNSYYALACDGNRFLTEVPIVPATLENANGEKYVGYTLDVSQKDIEKSDYVLECSSASSSPEPTYAFAKFRSNIVDSETGKRLSLKMGNSGGDSVYGMFNVGGADIDISVNQYNDSAEGYSLRHSTYGRLNLDEKSNGQLMFYWYKNYYNPGNYDILILTDSTGPEDPEEPGEPEQPEQPAEPEEPEGEQTFGRISVFSLQRFGAPISANDKILIVYKASDGTHYALTAKGAVPIADPTSDEYPNYSGPTPTIYTDVKYASSIVEWALGVRNGRDHYIELSGLKQGDKYLYAGEALESDDYPYGKDTASKISFLAVQNGYTADGGFNGDGYTLYADEPAINTGSGWLGWDQDTKSFIETGDLNSAAHFQIYGMIPGLIRDSYHEVFDLTKIEDWSKILITVEGSDGKQKLVIPYTDTDTLGCLDIPDNKADNPPCYFSLSDTILATRECALTPGDIISTSKKNFKIDALSWDIIGSTVYIDGYVKNGKMLDQKKKECMFSYTDDDSGIVLRGAKNWLYYDKDTGSFSAVSNKEDATVIRVWAVDTAGDTYTNVVFHGPDNSIFRELRTSQDIDLMKMPNVTNDEDGREYIFVGWSTDENSGGFLSLDDSCNLYDYYDVTDTGRIKPEAAEKFSIIGNCTPEVLDTINPADYTESDRLDLYPVYARRSFDTVVSACDLDAEGHFIPIVGISDWKDIQTKPEGGHNEKERWLGKIYCDIYKDGELWVAQQPMYFCYHNDDAADINLKFISDELLENYQDLDDPLLTYMSDENAFPAHAQKGNYVIDAVYASQGGSEDGLKYKYNWIAGNGGRLDNVEGGSTIDVYVTTLYQVEYFMDDVELTGEKWQNANFYATPGTDEAVAEAVAEAEYVVKTDNEYSKLMNHSVSDDSTFVDENIIRGDYSRFVYCINDYKHTIPIAELPEAPEGKVLTSDKWTMKIPSILEVKEYVNIAKLAFSAQEKGSVELKVAEQIAPESDYSITGTQYGTGNTVNSWVDDDDDNVYTYHLYIYSDARTTTITPPSTPVPNKTTTVYTGDDSSPILYLIVLTAALAATMGLLIYIRHKKEI